MGSDLTIVDVVQTTVGVVWIINDQRPTQAITILSLKMAVVPVSTLEKKRTVVKDDASGQGKVIPPDRQIRTGI